ncbi:MAG TPA: GGDEF domain-containing protein, partial [Acidimicrobiales bacterium]|nr:GGDEF domain-containing protein [Acidimicrobiales bacterium]
GRRLTKAFDLKASKVGDGFVVVFDDVTAARHSLEALQEQALHDPLTGLANRSLALQNLRHALAQLQRGSPSVAVFYLDLDGFKRINDLYGHNVGDELLREFAARLLSISRSTDTCSRIGGDEFLIICPEMDRSAAAQFAQRLTEAVNAPITTHDQDMAVSACVGVATTQSASADPGELIMHADMAMYEAKRRGILPYHAYTGPLEP